MELKNNTEIREILNLYFEDAPQEYLDSVLYGYRGIISANKYSKYNKMYMPDKGNRNIISFLLETMDLKYCAQCNNIIDISQFRKNNSTVSGLQDQCRDCHQENTSRTQAHRQAKRRTSIINRTPTWSEEEKIKEFYNKCPTGHHVDHIIPLQGKIVSGLHVLDNLQYLTEQENLKKGNKY